jgi:hypothetical protein
MMLKDRLLARWQIEDHMIRNLKRSWWLGALVAGFAIAVIATVQATITIAGTVIQATSVKPLTSREPRLNRPPRRTLADGVLNQLARPLNGNFHAPII